MSFKIQSVFVDISAKLDKLKSGLAKARTMIVSGIKTAMTAAIKVAAVGAAGITAALVGGIKLVSLASDLEEMESKFDAVFKEEASAANAFATNLANGVGRAQSEIKGFMAGLQDLFVPMGFARDDARNLSQTVTQLGVDLASFNNMTDAEAIETLNAGLTGSHEVLKKFGVFVNDNTLSLKLQEMGLAKNAQSATEQAKALARLQIIMESTTDAQGDALKTSDGLANQWKRLQGQLLTLGQSIGKTLIPAAKQVVSVFQNIVSWLQSNQGALTGVWDMMQEKVMAFVAYVRPTVEAMIAALINAFVVFGPIVMKVIYGIASVYAKFVMGFYEGAAKVIQWFSKLSAAAMAFGARTGGIFSWVTQVTDLLGKAWQKLKEIATSAFGWIRQLVEDMVFMFLNWDLVVQTVGLKMAESFENMKLRIQNLWRNAVILVEWGMRNWKDILADYINLYVTMFKNLGKNIKSIWTGILNFIKGKGFKVDFTPITEGFKSQIKEMPALEEFVATDKYKDAMQELNNNWGKRREEFEKTMKENAPTAGEDVVNAVSDALKNKGKPPKVEIPKLEFNPDDFKINGEIDNGKESEKSSAGSFRDVASVWKEMQSSILKNEDKLQQKQVALAEQQLAEQKKGNEMLARNRGPAAFAV